MKRNYFWHVAAESAHRASLVLACLILGCFVAPFALAQDEVTSDAGVTGKFEAAASNSIDDVVLSAEAQKKVVNAIYNATKTAKTETDYTAFVTLCENALKNGLSDENRQYVNSLVGWGLNRRGQKRFELAVQLKKIGNRQHVEKMNLAMEDFDRAVIADSNRYRSWMSRGIANVEIGNYDLAISDFTRVVKLKPDSGNGWFNRAEALYQRSRPANLAKTQRNEDESQEAMPHNTLEQQRMGYQQAISDYDVAIRLNSNDTQALTGRGHAKFALAQFEEALKDYEEVIRLVPTNATAYLNRGDVHQQLENWNAASTDYTKSLAIEKTEVACQRTAWFLATCPDETFRKPSEALNLIKQAIKMGGDSATYLDTLAAAEAAAGNFEVAKTTQEKVIGLVSAEFSSDENPYQARLALYEKGKAYTQSNKVAATPNDAAAKETTESDSGKK